MVDLLSNMFPTTAIALSVLIPFALAAEPFNPGFYATPFTGFCATGKLQSPIDIPADSCTPLPEVPAELLTSIKMPVVSASVTENTGISMKVEWDALSAFDINDTSIFPMVAAGGDKISDVYLTGAPVEFRLKMIPINVHWHVVSEHAIDGNLAPMEAHIVTAVGPDQAPPDWGCDALWEGGEEELEKCIAVFATRYHLQEGAPEPAYLTKLFDSFPTIAGDAAPYPGPFDLAEVIPIDLSHVSFVGSLTTPPCPEGLRWHVFTKQVPIPLETVTRYEVLFAGITDRDTGETQKYRHNNRPVLARNGRTIYNYTDPKGKKKEKGIRGYCKK